MAVYDFNVTVAEVKEKTPLDMRQVPASSTADRLDETDITDWIEEGASEFSGLLQKASIATSDLGDDAEKQIQKGIVHYAVAEILSSTGHTGDAYERARDKYQDARDRYTDSPQLLDHQQSRVTSNVETDPTHTEKSDFTRRDYEP